MIKIAFRDENNLSVIGMKEILDLCIPQKKEYFNFITETNCTMDIIITSLVPGELNLCYPDFKEHPGALIIGVANNEISIPNEMPECCRDILIISRKESILKLRGKIIKSLKNRRIKRMSCNRCTYTKRSHLGISLMRLILNGNSVEQCTESLNCGPKAFYAAKYSFMAKCGLNNNFELVTLARALMRRKYYTHAHEVNSPPFFPEFHSSRR
ncbi:hypothetical protein [Enterobacter wuhouensis]|uniref:hypothetical protein n=1 Tax=Enterobacter wuhouensis TaxID=2529381 RepID=UPI003D782D71